MVEFHPNFSALHPHTLTTCRPGLIEALRQSICLGMIRRCETMINVTQVDERGNKSGSKDGSTICDNYSEELHA
ncbi:hypothetical protein TNCV_1082541 [Trichonephila clavipes]|nr:hypothetical protein TNCV_1082541 [Trichonephila clavipes]